MIEPIIGERQCSACKACRPAHEFAPKSSKCRACRTHQQCALRRARKKSGRKGSNRERQDFSNVPADPRTFGQQLLAATQRRWSYPVEPAQNLRWIA